MTAFRSQTDAMLAAKFDPEPYVWPGGYRTASDGHDYVLGKRPEFDPRPEFIPGPLVCDYGFPEEHRAPYRAWCNVTMEPAVRPEPNPILVAFRENRGDNLSIQDALDACGIAESWNAGDDPDPEWSPDMIDHARKVLTRLAALDEPSALHDLSKPYGVEPHDNRISR